MHSIEISNFGPLIDVKMQSNKIVFLLGEQASGKSTLAKLVYFFRTFQEEFIGFVFASDSKNWPDLRRLYIAALRHKFIGIFGDSKTLGNFNLRYSYTKTEYVVVKPLDENNYLDVTLSSDLDKKLESAWNKTQKVLSYNKENAYDVYLNILKDSASKKDILSELNQIFDDNAYIVYIPAGRAFLSHQELLRLIQAEEIKRINPQTAEFDGIMPQAPLTYYDIIDAPTRRYITEVSRVRDWHLSAQIKDKLSRTPKNEYPEYVSKLAKDILKGAYFADMYNDYLELRNNERIKMSYASSGQQEVIWLLNLLIFFIAEKRKCLLIIEEPETHLHPEAQYMLAKAIAAFCNCTDSQTVLTTHSPYVLSSFNNLIYAGKCSKNNMLHDKLNEIIQKESWLEPETFSSYILENGESRNIRDDDLVMIDIAELDAVASAQDTEYEKMLSLSSEVR